MAIDLRTVDLRKLNSMTNYPSIPTYHRLVDGKLTDEVAVDFPAGEVMITEKIDGTNSRVILLPGGEYLIGSREELLYDSGDLLGDRTLGIVEALQPVAKNLYPSFSGIRVYYFEVYGGKVTSASKHYTKSQQVGARLFDAATIPDYEEILSWPRERIASWRDHGGQEFFDVDELLNASSWERVPLVSNVAVLHATELPTSLEETLAWLREHASTTQAALDGTPGRAEGVVLRTPDRSVIAKARTQDYERALAPPETGRRGRRQR